MGYAQWAAFAERIAARAELLWPVPDDWTAEEGAAFPVNYFTAYFAYWKAGLIGRRSRSGRCLASSDSRGRRRRGNGCSADRKAARRRNVWDLFF